MSQQQTFQVPGSSPIGDDLHVARYIVSAGGEADGANYTTIASAYAAAVAAGGNQTVFIQPGVYTENVTLSPNVNLAAFNCDGQTPNVTILGKLSASGSGITSLSGIRLKTNSDFCVSITGSGTTHVSLISCFIEASNNTALNLASSSSNSSILLFDCVGNIDTTGITYFTHSGAGFMTFTGGYFRNDGGSSTASTVSAGGQLNFYNTFFSAPITTSSTSTLTAVSTQLYAEIIVGGTGNNEIFNTYVSGGANSAISISSGAVLKLYESSIDSTNTNAITGAGTLRYGGVSFVNTSETINTTTQNPDPFPVAQGGTGISSIAAYSPIIGGTTNTGPFQAANAGQSNAGYVWTSNGATSAPSFQASSSGNSAIFSVKLSANQAGVTGDNTTYQILYDDVIVDTASGYNAGTGLYTFPFSGQYQINILDYVYTSSGTATSGVMLGYALVNGSTNIRIFDNNPLAFGLTANGEFMVSASFIYNATAGDTMGIFLQLNGGTKNIGVAGGTEACLFSGALL